MYQETHFTQKGWTGIVYQAVAKAKLIIFYRNIRWGTNGRVVDSNVCMIHTKFDQLHILHLRFLTAHLCLKLILCVVFVYWNSSWTQLDLNVLSKILNSMLALICHYSSTINFISQKVLNCYAAPMHLIIKIGFIFQVELMFRNKNVT